MTQIHPFRAIRPTRDKVHLVATRPYYTYKRNVLRAKLQDNPFTFLHIINPEFGRAKTTEPNSEERFELVGEAYAEYIDEGILMQDISPHLYIYRQTKDGREYLGVVAGASLDEYDNGTIKKHEDTITIREKIFTNYLHIVGYNAEPVLLSYSDPSERIERLIQEKIRERPEYEYMTTDRIKHELWLMNSEESLMVIDAFQTVPNAYIADGHHRSASSARLRETHKERGEEVFPNENFFLAFFMDEKRMHIVEYNRLIKSLNGMDETKFVLELSDHFEVEPLKKRQKPQAWHEMTMCIRGNWYWLKCKPHILEDDHPVKKLDANILTRTVLDPMLGIKDLKNDNNIDFIEGDQKLKKIEKKIAKGQYEAAFILYPVEMQDIKDVADAGLTMPPKSTWIEPKLRSGLTIYHINE